MSLSSWQIGKQKMVNNPIDNPNILNKKVYYNYSTYYFLMLNGLKQMLITWLTAIGWLRHDIFRKFAISSFIKLFMI